MSWLRIDDGFASNYKIAALTDRQLRVWMRVLCYCARAQDPTVDAAVIQEVSGLDNRLISRLRELDLLDESGDSYEVHDWALYQPKDLTGAERQARWRARRNGMRNGADNGTRNAKRNDPDRDETVTSRAGTRARPVPSPSSLSPSAVASYPPAGRKDEIEAHRIEPLAQLAAAAHADDDIPL